MPPALHDSESRGKPSKVAGWLGRIPRRTLILAAALLLLSLLLFLYAWFNSPYVRTSPGNISNIYRPTPGVGNTQPTPAHPASPSR